MDYLGDTQVASLETNSPEQVKNVTGYSKLDTGTYKADKNYYLTGKWTEGGVSYFEAPWNWVDIPRNYLEDRGSYTLPNEAFYMGLKDGWQRRYKLVWKGKAIRFSDPQRYINALKLTRNTPIAYIEFLKLAPLAGFNIGIAPFPGQSARRGYHDHDYNNAYSYQLPPQATGAWWREVIIYYLLQTSFNLVRMAQIEDRDDLLDAYNNAGLLITELRAEMENEVPVTIQPYTDSHLRTTGTPFTVMCKLEDAQKKQLVAVMNEARKTLYDENLKKMAERYIELSDVDATIAQTDFSMDPAQNPYLVYNPATHSYTNVARNTSATFNPPDIKAPESSRQYWEQVPEFQAQHERRYLTDEGLVSSSDIATYGLGPQERKTNWIPWLAAGAAVAAVAATQL